MAPSKRTDIREDEVMQAQLISLQGFLEDSFEFNLFPAPKTLGKVLISHEVVVDLFDQVVC